MRATTVRRLAAVLVLFGTSGCSFDSARLDEFRCADDSDFVDDKTCCQGYCVDEGPGSGAPADRDEDGIPDALDNCPDLATTDESDADGDGVGDACDCAIDDDAFGVNALFGVDVHLNETVTIFGTGRFDIINDSSDSLDAKVYLGLRFGF